MKSDKFIRIQTVRPNDLIVNDDVDEFTCQPCVSDDVIDEEGQEDLLC